MPEIIAQVTIKAGGAYHPPGSVIELSQKDCDSLITRGFATPVSGDREPEAGPVGGLPEDIPARAALVAAGCVDLDDVAELVEAGTLTGVEGIGPATAAKVEAYLDAHYFEEE